MDGNAKAQRFTRSFVEHRLACGGVLNVQVTFDDAHIAVIDMSCALCGDTLREAFSDDEALEIRTVLVDVDGFLRCLRDAETRAVN